MRILRCPGATNFYAAEAAASAAAQGKSLCDLLSDLFKRYGYYQEGAQSLTLKGKEGASKIKAMMNKLRDQPPVVIHNLAVHEIADFLTSVRKNARTGEVIEHYDLPASNVLMFVLEDGTKAIARPSGTEPKIKFYFLTREPGDDLACAQATATAKINGIADDLIQQVT